MVVDHTVREGDTVLDAGAGTGLTSLLAAEKVGPFGQVVLLDLSAGMLESAERKAKPAGLQERLHLQIGDMLHLPFEEGTFDAVISTYSACPVADPAKAVREMYRVLKPGGHLGIAHSVEPNNRLLRFVGDKVESAAWRCPWISLGCRAVSILPTLEEAGAKIVFKKRLGVPLWPLFVFVVEKPANHHEPDMRMDRTDAF